HQHAALHDSQQQHLDSQPGHVRRLFPAGKFHPRKVGKPADRFEAAPGLVSLKHPGAALTGSAAPPAGAFSPPAAALNRRPQPPPSTAALNRRPQPPLPTAAPNRPPPPRRISRLNISASAPIRFLGAAAIGESEAPAVAVLRRVGWGRRAPPHSR